MMKRSLFTLFVLIALFEIGSAQTDTTTVNKIGDKAPVFNCTTIDGLTVDISKMKGKVVLLNFFATWCGPCNMELPVLQKNVWTKYKDNPRFALVIIGREHSEKEVKDFVAKKQFTMPFAPDPDRSIFKLYATQNIPRNVVIGKDGKIAYQSMGYTEEEFKKLEDVIAARLKD